MVMDEGIFVTLGTFWAPSSYIQDGPLLVINGVIMTPIDGLING